MIRVLFVLVFALGCRDPACSGPCTTCGPCAATSDCATGHRCLKLFALGGSPAPACLPQPYPPACAGEGSGEICDSFGRDCLDGGVLMEPWRGARSDTCGWEYVRCPNGCEVPTDGGRPAPRCR